MSIGKLLRALSVGSVCFIVAACMTSKEPMIDPDSRVLPFAPPTRVEVYHRKSSREPWRRDEKGIMTLIAGPDLIVRYKENSGSEAYSFYPLGPRRFLAQGSLRPNEFIYGVLEIQNGEGILSMMNCDNLDETNFRKAGGTIVARDPKRCSLDGIRNPLDYLTNLAAKPFGSQIRYVPVR
jgi:hypothetical protein